MIMPRRIPYGIPLRQHSDYEAKKADMRNQKIMARTLPEEYTGTLEGDLAPSDITFFRLPEYGGRRTPRLCG